MKNSLLTFILSLAVIIASAQSQRFLVFEEFTNASCGPCASQNPGFQALMAANSSKCTFVTYHWNYPGPNDPMYLHNPTDMLSRIGYYGFNFVPSCVMDGITIPSCSSYYGGAPGCITQTQIDNKYAVPSPLELYVNQRLSPGNDSIYVTMLGKATQDVSGTLVAHLVVIEKHIHFNTAPGSNGEKDFYNVMKKMLPGASGTTLASSYSNGDYFIIEQAWKLANVYNNSELSVVGFVQNNQNKNVQQAANTTATPITGVYANDVELTKLSNVTPTYCSSTISPVVSIRNNGSAPLTSLVFQYGVNGNMQSYTWNGNLGFLGKAQIQLPAANYTLAHENQLLIYVSNTNSVEDDYHKNDTIRYSFPDALQVGTVATVKIKTDNNPQETTWVITDPDGVIIGSGGPYAAAATTYTEDVNLGFGTCYQFTIFDAGGNGICCGANGNGYYKLTSGSITIESGTQFGASESAQFYSQSGVGIPSAGNVLQASVYPNPANHSATLTFSTDMPDKASVKVYDMLGNEVMSIAARQYDPGRHEIPLDCSTLPSGLYNARISSGNKALNLKLTVNR